MLLEKVCQYNMCDTIVSEYVHGMLELRKGDWPYFIGKIFELFENINFAVSRHLGNTFEVSGASRH